MKRLRNTFKILIAVLLFTSCSSDDSNSISAPDNLHPSEWANTVGGLVYDIYFSVDNKVYFYHPIDIEIEGTYSYEKPNLTLNFTGQCTNSGFVFSECDVTASINGNTLTVNDNGQEFEFYKLED